MFWAGLLLGAAVAAAATLVGARIAIRRSVARARRAERRARDAERLAEIGSLTSGLAHEIKNPLSTIGLNASLLAEAIEDLDVPADATDPLARRIRTLRREVDRLREILEDFLRFAGELRMERRPVDVREPLRELADFYEPQSAAAGVRQRLDVPGEPLMVEADPTYLKQALLNLIINATQAMSERKDGRASALTVRAWPQRDEEWGETVRIAVEDTGPGVPEDKAERVFMPYVTSKKSGAGLGLAIAKRVIEEHGGRIDLENRPGEGATFMIRLPAASHE